MRPGGQLYSMRWRMSSLTNHQFLTAEMIICFILHHQGLQASLTEMGLEKKEEIRTLLKTVQSMWSRSRSSSAEARRASEALGIVLCKLASLDSDTQGDPSSKPSGTTESIETGEDNIYAAMDLFRGKQRLWSHPNFSVARCS